MNGFNTILLSVLLSLLPATAYGQMEKGTIEDIKDANSYYYFEDYEEALPLYLSAIKKHPQNSNLQYRIGFCYLNIPGSKKLSIPYLENACKNLTKNYQEDNVYEPQAPFDALFYLGNAYFINNQIPKALETYKKFRNLISAEKRTHWDYGYLEHQEETAKSSVIIQKHPINFLMQNIGNKFNDRFSNFNATISYDGNTIAYTSKRKFYNAIYISRKNAEGKWSTPTNITLDLAVDGNCSTLSLSADGRRLYLFKDENHDGNIFISTFNGTKWSPMTKLNKHINTQYYETHATESPDGKFLLFSSNRKGGYGDLDIYISQLTPMGDWGVATNLGKNINTRYNENTPFLSTDGELLFFSSEGHKNIGGYDIFVSQNGNYKSWSTPINLGYPLNTPDDNLFFCPTEDGSKGYYSYSDETGYGNLDIYEINLYIPKFMKGMVLNSEFSERKSNNNFQILVIDTISSIGTALVDKRATNFDISIDPQNPAKLFYEGRTYNVSEKIQYADLQLIEEQRLKRQQEIQQRLAQQKYEEQLSIIESNRIDSINKSMLAMQEQNSQYLTSDTISKKIEQSKMIFSEYEQNPDPSLVFSSNKENTNYLTELLLLLAPNKDQALLTRILKQDWQFHFFNNNSKLIEFTSSFKTHEEREAMLETLARFMDFLYQKANITSIQKNKYISTNNDKVGFIDFYNQIINKSSNDLSEVLGNLLVNNPKITSFEELIVFLKNQNPQLYSQHIDELLRILTQQSINVYSGLSNEEKYNLYTTFEQQNESKPPYLYLLLLLLIATLVAGVYLIKRKKE